MKPICVKCQRFYRIKKTGVYFIEAMPVNNDVPPGTIRPEGWKPYKTWMGDLFECQGCGSQAVVGVGVRPISEHFKPGFADEVKLAEFQVNDC